MKLSTEVNVFPVDQDLLLTIQFVSLISALDLITITSVFYVLQGMILSTATVSQEIVLLMICQIDHDASLVLQDIDSTTRFVT